MTRRRSIASTPVEFLSPRRDDAVCWPQPAARRLAAAAAPTKSRTGVHRAQGTRPVPIWKADARSGSPRPAS